MRSQKIWGNCAPDFGAAELDFEPLPEKYQSICEWACTPTPMDDVRDFERYMTALCSSVLTELAAANVAPRVVVRGITFHPVDSRNAVFRALGALAVREVLDCITEDRDPESTIDL